MTSETNTIYSPEVTSSSIDANWTISGSNSGNRDLLTDSFYRYPTCQTPSGEDENLNVSLAAQIAVGITLGCVSLVTIAGNLLVLVAVAVTSNLRNTTHYFIANLAVADLMVGTAVLPFSASLEVLRYWAFGHLFCDIWAALDVLCCTASILSLCVISIDRYIGVTRPLQHSAIVNEFRAGCTVVGVWLLSFAISVAPLFGWKEPPSEDPCVCNVTKQTGYVIFSVSGSFYVPLTIILVVYYRVYREALCQSRFLATGIKVLRSEEHRNGAVTLRVHAGNSKSAALARSKLMLDDDHVRRTDNYRMVDHEPCLVQQHQLGQQQQLQQHDAGCRATLAKKIAKFNREKKAAQTLGIVVGIFILCWFPFFFVLPLEAVCHRCAPPEWLFKIIFWLGYCNSTMNPVIYACASREFKMAFVRVLRCQCSSRSNNRRNRQELLLMQNYSAADGGQQSKKILKSSPSNDGTSNHFRTARSRASPNYASMIPTSPTSSSSSRRGRTGFKTRSPSMELQRPISARPRSASENQKKLTGRRSSRYASIIVKFKTTIGQGQTPVNEQRCLRMEEVSYISDDDVSMMQDVTPEVGDDRDMN